MYFEDCPFYRKAEDLLETVLKETGIKATVAKKNVVSDEMAVAEQFVGSPSIRINGVDIDPSARASKAYCLMCRIYWTEEGFLGWPTREMLETALREAQNQLSYRTW